MRTRIRWSRSSVIPALLLCVAARLVTAQELHGTVRDSVSRGPVAGAVLMLLDRSGATIGRNITNQRGEYRIALTSVMTRIRVVRIGFRPREARIPEPVEGVARLDVVMTAIASMLAPVQVTDNSHCARRKDRPTALALWEQARLGLLATIVARDVTPTRMKRLGFVLDMDGTSDRITSQRVLIDSTVLTSSPFVAVRSADEFVQSGFARDSAGHLTYYGPDADILLNEAFALAYCFHIMDAERSRPNQVGLGFVAADRKRDRIDIEGALWIDTVARSLTTLEFKYAGQSRAMSASLPPGGRVAFREMANGLVLIDRWHIRMITEQGGTVLDGPGRMTSLWSEATEKGGELARAEWPDGSSWRAPLGTLRVQATTHAGGSSAGTIVRLRGTGYWATTDSAGALEIVDLLPGPYTAAVVHPALISVGLDIPIPLKFVAARDSIMHFKFETPTLEDFIAKECLSSKRTSDPLNGTAWLLARVTSSSAGPIEGLNWSLGVQTSATEWKTMYSGKMGSDGQFQVCKLKLGSTIRLTLQREGFAPQIAAERRLDEKLTVAPLAWSPK